LFSKTGLREMPDKRVNEVRAPSGKTHPGIAEAFTNDQSEAKIPKSSPKMACSISFLDSLRRERLTLLPYSRTECESLADLRFERRGGIVLGVSFAL
jgi:hypothetical protein